MNSVYHLSLERHMSAPTLIPRPNAGDVLSRVMTPLHDSWMGDADQILDPLMRRDTTFWERWAAVNYLRDQFPERFTMEQELLTELHSFLTPEANERLRMQTERLTRQLTELEMLGEQRAAARQMACAVRTLLEDLRLWYAEIEIAAGGIRRVDLGARAAQLLDRLGRAVTVPKPYPDLTLSIDEVCRPVAG
jgi:hypothetical protein